MIKFAAAFSLLLCCLVACKDKNSIPDVSGIKADLNLYQFEKDFFSLDTNKLDAGLDQLSKKDPEFFRNYLGKILGIDNDMIQKGQADTAIRSFLSSYRSVYDSSVRIFGDMSKTVAEVKKTLQFTKYYFPDYHLPTKLITFIGPMDAYGETSYGIQGDILTSDAMGIGLQLHMGKNFSYYLSKEGQELYPEYISRQFEPGYIAINVAKNMVDDLFPEKDDPLPLVQKMVDKGRRLYLLSRLVPYEEENKLISYTPQEFQICKLNEAVIWDLFVQNNLLQVSDKNIIKNYISVGPKTPEITNNEGISAPGNVGSYAGWQIVKKYMSKNPGTKMQQLMTMDPETIYTESKYKP